MKANPQLENGYVRIASEIIEALCKFRIPGECRQVLDCVFRKTYGYQKKEDWISNSQIVEMTGMKKQNASRALAKLITNNIVIQSDDKLSLNKNYQEWVSFKSSSKVMTGKKNSLSAKVIKPVIKLATSVIQSDDSLSAKVMDTIDNKDNIQKILIQKKAHLLEEDLIEISERYKVPLNMVKLAREEMDNWLAAKGKRYSDYKAGLRNWVLRDAKKQIEGRQNGRSRVSIDINKI